MLQKDFDNNCFIWRILHFINRNDFLSILFQSIDLSGEGEEVRKIKILVYIRVPHKSLKKTFIPPFYLRLTVELIIFHF